MTEYKFKFNTKSEKEIRKNERKRINREFTKMFNFISRTLQDPDKTTLYEVSNKTTYSAKQIDNLLDGLWKKWLMFMEEEENEINKTGRSGI